MGCYTVLGVFDYIDDTARAVSPIESKLSIGADDMKFLSATPYPHGVVFDDHTPIPLWKFALIGGVLGFGVGVALAGGTNVLMNLPVGGKAPFSVPAVAVLTYEITLLGAILGTLSGMLWMHGLPDWRELAYDADISRGKIGLLVRCSEKEQASIVEEMMRECGAKKVRHGRDDF